MAFLNEKNLERCVIEEGGVHQKLWKWKWGNAPPRKSRMQTVKYFQRPT